MDKGAVDSVCVDIEIVWGCWASPVDGVANSEFSLLSSPALKTLFGRLPLPAGEPAPPGPVEPGLLFLSPNICPMYSSKSLRLSARPGIGAISLKMLANELLVQGETL